MTIEEQIKWIETIADNYESDGLILSVNLTRKAADTMTKMLAVTLAADEYYDFITVKNGATGMRSYKLEMALAELTDRDK